MVNLKELKKHIVPEERLFLNGDVVLLPRELVKEINCYYFVLGILYSTGSYYDCIPGFTTGDLYTNSSDLISSVETDLKNLNISFRRISIFEAKNLQEDEVLIKLFYYPPSKAFPKGDFHFIRQNKETGIWYHKPGANQVCCLEGIDDKENFDPDELIFTEESTKEIFRYFPLCYFALKE